MYLLKSASNRHFYERLSYHLKNPSSQSPLDETSSLNSFSNCLLTALISSIQRKPFSVSAQAARNLEEGKNNVEPLSVTFKKAVLLEDNTCVIDPVENEGAENLLSIKLRQLEDELRSLNSKGDVKVDALNSKSEDEAAVVKDKPSRSLWALFADAGMKKWVRSVKPADFGCEDEAAVVEDKPSRSSWALFADDGMKQQVRSVKPADFGCEDDSDGCKGLPPDMVKFARHLYLGGYFEEAKFRPMHEFDSTRFESGYARGFLRFAAISFAKDHREIVKWLSASDLKKVALFGCPSLGGKTVRAAKVMRRFFEIDEKEVCAKCKLKSSCTHANKTFDKCVNKLHLDCVTRVLTMYAMKSTPEQLVVPEEIKKSVSRLLNEIINLSKTVSRDLSKTPPLRGIQHFRS